MDELLWSSRTQALRHATVRVFGADGALVGTGFLVGIDLIATCMHVHRRGAGGAADPFRALTVDFPYLDKERRLRTYALQDLRATGRADDIQVLRINGTLPPRALPLVLPGPADPTGHAFRCLGFPEGKDPGAWTHGQVMDWDSDGLLQLNCASNSGFPVDEGFSGAAVWDDDANAIAGMVVRVETSAAVDVAYAIPIGAIVTAWPILRLYTPVETPYRALSAFREKDSSNFFGRKDLSTRLAAMVAASEVATLTGASGAGKTSLIHAGLVPELRDRQEGWAVITVRPSVGGSPFTALASELLRYRSPGLSGEDLYRSVDALASELKSVGVSKLLDVVEQCLVRQSSRKLLLVLDQFEEIFLMDPEVRVHFTAVLADSVEHDRRLGRGQVHLLLAVRADLLSDLLSLPGLGPLAGERIFGTSRMTRSDLLSAICEPAKKEDVYFEEGLPETIVRDLGEAQSLPDLQFMLAQLWALRSDQMIRHSAYRSLGGVTGAIARRAEEVFRTLVESDKMAAARLLVQLVSQRPERKPVATPARRINLDEESWEVARRLSIVRLVTIDSRQGYEVVELAHEALAEDWYRLRQWLDEASEFRTWQDQVRQRMDNWTEVRSKAAEVLPRQYLPDPRPYQVPPAPMAFEGREVGSQTSLWERVRAGARLREGLDDLLRGKLLQDAPRWLRERPKDLSQREVEYIKISQAAVAASARRGKVQAWLSVVLFIGSAISAGLVGTQYQETRQARAEGSALALIQAAQEAQGSHPGQSILLTLAAAANPDVQEAQRWLGEQAFRYRHLERVAEGSYPASAIEHLPDGRLAVGQRDGRVAIWAADLGTVVRTERAHRRPISDLAVVGNDGRLVSVSADNTAVWTIKDQAAPPQLSSRPMPGGDLVAGSRRQSPFAVYSASGQLTVTLPNSSVVARILRQNISAIAFSSDGERLLAVANDEVLRWKLTPRGLEAVPPVPIERDIPNLISDAIAYGIGNEGVIVTSRGAGRVEIPDGSVRGSRLIVSPEGGTVAMVHDGASILLLDVKSGAPVTTPLRGSDSPIADMAFVKGGQSLMAVDASGNLYLWKVPGTVPQDRAFGIDSRSRATSVAMDSDGKRTAIATPEGVILGTIGQANSKYVKLADAERLAVSSGGRYVAATVGRRLYLLNAEAGQLEDDVVLPSTILAILFTPDERSVLAVVKSSANTIHLHRWSPDTGDLSSTSSIPARTDMTAIMAVSQDGLVAVSDGDRSMSLIDTASGDLRVVTTVSIEGGPVTALALSPDGTVAAVSNAEGVQLRTVARNSLQSEVGLPPFATALSFSDDGRMLLAAYQEGRPEVILSNVGSDDQRVLVLQGDSVHPAHSTPNANSRLLWTTAITTKESTGQYALTIGDDTGRFVAFELDAPSWRQELCKILSSLSPSAMEQSARRYGDALSIENYCGTVGGR